MRPLFILLLSVITLSVNSKAAPNDSLRKYYVEYILNRLVVLDYDYYWSIHAVCPDGGVRKVVLSLDFIESLATGSNSQKDIMLRDTVSLDSIAYAKVMRWGEVVDDSVYAQLKDMTVAELANKYTVAIAKSKFCVVKEKGALHTALLFFFDRNLYPCSLLDLAGESVVDLTSFDERYLYKTSCQRR